MADESPVVTTNAVQVEELRNEIAEFQGYVDDLEDTDTDTATAVFFVEHLLDLNTALTDLTGVPCADRAELEDLLEELRACQEEEEEELVKWADAQVIRIAAPITRELCGAAVTKSGHPARDYHQLLNFLRHNVTNYDDLVRACGNPWAGRSAAASRLKERVNAMIEDQLSAIAIFEFDDLPWDVDIGEDSD